MPLHNENSVIHVYELVLPLENKKEVSYFTRTAFYHYFKYHLSIRNTFEV